MWTFEFSGFFINLKTWVFPTDFPALAEDEGEDGGVVVVRGGAGTCGTGSPSQVRAKRQAISAEPVSPLDTRPVGDLRRTLVHVGKTAA